MHLKYICGLVLLGFSFMSTTCLRNSDQLSLLYDKTWLHAVEEDSADVLVYRPNTYAFPPSRGRTGFGLEENGTFRLLSIAPTDGLEEHIGSWKKKDKNILQVRFNENEPGNFDLEIISARPDLIKARKINLSQ